MAAYPHPPIDNPASNATADSRRTGASSSDPDPVGELVPAGAGELPATRQSAAETAEDLAFTDTQVPNLLDEVADVDGMGTLDAQLAPGYGPGELDKPQLQGNPDLGIDPNDVVPAENRRDGVHETGKRPG